jgi:hypothetical protein
VTAYRYDFDTLIDVIRAGRPWHQVTDCTGCEGGKQRSNGNTCVTRLEIVQRLGINGARIPAYQENGLRDWFADRLAIRAGFHPFSVWPEMCDHRIERYDHAS